MWKIQSKQNHKIYAMKEISKVKAFMKKSLSSIILEKHILSNLHHPFLANLNFSFQDKEYLYLVLDFLPGGDLRFYLNKGIVFSEIQIKFFISNLILALDYIHKMNIIHRDIKPENLVFDGRGYLHITDFGIARKMKDGKQILDKSGTPGYLAPEVLIKKPQNYSSDFFSLGVICYELVFRKKPFRGKNKKEIAEKILYKNIKLKSEDMPLGFSHYMADFINRLLKRNQEERLGNNGIEEIKSHPWLEGVDWKLLENKNVDSEYIPFTPFIGDNFERDLVNKKDHLNYEHYDDFLKKINQSEIFKNFYFNYYDANYIHNKNRSNTTKEKPRINNNNKTNSTNSGNKTTRTMSDENETSFDNNNGIFMMKNTTFLNDVNNNDLEIKKQLSC